jgi:D-inositol-3-phosphate glycosyltransferase
MMLSRGAIDHARQYSWSRTASGLIAVYREAMFDHRETIAAELGLALRETPVGVAA